MEKAYMWADMQAVSHDKAMSGFRKLLHFWKTDKLAVSTDMLMSVYKDLLLCLLADMTSPCHLTRPVSSQP